MEKSKSFLIIIFSVVCLSIGFVFASQSHIKSEAENLTVESGTISKISISAQSDRTNTFPVSIPSPEEIPHNVVAAFYDVQNFPTAKLLLNNKDIVAREVRPTLYNLDGNILEVAPVMVEANSHLMIDLRDWANLGGESFNRGSLKLFHTGKDLVIGSQIYLEDVAQSLSFEERLGELGKFDSRRLESVWWMPRNQTQVTIILSNTSDTLVSVTAKLRRKPQQIGESQTFTLLPHQTRVLDLRDDFTNGNQFADSEIVGLSLEHTGGKSALKAHGQIKDAPKGYSNIINFSNPNTAKSAELHGTGLHLGAIGDEELEPIVAVKNVGTERTNVTAKIPYTRTDGTTGIIDLGSTNLKAGEMRLLNMNSVIRTSRREQIQIAGIEIEYDVAPGSVIVQTQSVSENRRQVFRVPMSDPFAQTSATGGYPWRIDETSSTFAYIKNTTGAEKEYVALLTYNGGEYLIGLEKIAPRKTVAIDVKKLRDEQTPDERGKTIPPSVSSGQIKWTIRSETYVNDTDLRKSEIIGRSEQIDMTRGISSSYACQNCCQKTAWGWISSGGVTEAEVGDQIQFTAHEEGTDCYGNRYGPYQISNSEVDWDSSDENIATITNFGLATIVGVGDGDVGIDGHWRRVVTGNYGNYCPPLLTGQSEVKQNPGEKTNAEEMLVPDCSICYTVSRPLGSEIEIFAKPKIQIRRNNQNISNTTQNVIVGQQMNLSATITGGTPSSHQWTVPGNSNDRVANYEATGSIGRVTDLTQLSNANVQFYWVSGGDSRQVTYSATIGGRQYSKTATFNVKRPTVTVTSVTHRTTIYTRGQQQYLLFGEIFIRSTDGIRFTKENFQVPSGFSGDTVWVQTIDYAYTRTLNDGQTIQTQSGIGLDARFPYSDNDPNATATADSPSICLRVCDDNISKTRMQTRIDADMYLMFKPNNLPSGESAIYVPLRKVTWNWTAVATRRPDFLFELPANCCSNSPNSTGVDTTNFPQWTRVVTGTEPYQ